MKRHHLVILLWLTVSVFGAAMAFSATYVNLTIYDYNAFISLFKQLIIILVLGLLFSYVFLKQKKINIYQEMKKYSVPLLYGTVIALIVVLLIGDLAKRQGARMVIPLLVFDFQPLELFKITLILYFAKLFSDIRPSDAFIDNIKKLLPVFCGVILVAIQPDLGGALICLILIYLLVLVNGQNKKQIKIFTLLGAMGGVAGYFLLHDYQKARILMWLNPFKDAQNSGFQLINSFVAISNGGPLGSGYMSGIQKAGYLSQPGSDFIFATICEELGFFGAFFTVGLLFALAILIINIGTKAHERFGMLYCYGFGLLLLIQTFVNVGGVTGLIPMTGVTLPFISSGLNSYIFLTLGVFLTVPISKESIKEKKRERKATNFKG